ncbi:Transposase [Lachnospiraceae bacterium TWA4]|nr:Transposase [Lachnospiraceae bacterium TWA4]
MHKVAKRILQFAMKHQIDTIIYGQNIYWKQQTTMGNVSNQNFVQIPFNLLKNNLSYLCEEHGICLIGQEESYTSKADFLADDCIPTYNEDHSQESVTFSGKRITRGLYRSNNGQLINADLNASANIGRKCLPNLFKQLKPDFNHVLIFKHPDQEFVHLTKKQVMGVLSHAKIKRLRRKGLL